MVVVWWYHTIACTIPLHVHHVVQVDTVVSINTCSTYVHHCTYNTVLSNTTVKVCRCCTHRYTPTLRGTGSCYGSISRRPLIPHLSMLCTYVHTSTTVHLRTTYIAVVCILHTTASGVLWCKVVYH